MSLTVSLVSSDQEHPPPRSRRRLCTSQTWICLTFRCRGDPSSQGGPIWTGWAPGGVEVEGVGPCQHWETRGLVSTASSLHTWSHEKQTQLILVSSLFGALQVSGLGQDLTLLLEGATVHLGALLARLPRVLDALMLLLPVSPPNPI